MTEQTKIIVADYAEIAALRAEVREIRSMLEGATITPAAEWVSLQEAAAHFGVHITTIHRRIENGSLQAKGSGKLRRVKIR